MYSVTRALLSAECVKAIQLQVVQNLSQQDITSPLLKTKHELDVLQFVQDDGCTVRLTFMSDKCVENVRNQLYYSLLRHLSI